MISYVWTSENPVYAGRGGTEAFTIGHIKELKARGIPARIITVGLGEKDGREFNPGIDFHNIDDINELEQLDDTIIFIDIPYALETRNQSYVFFHIPPLDERQTRTVDYSNSLGNNKIITNSRYMRNFWADYLGIKPSRISVVYPFADPAFSKVQRDEEEVNSVARVLYAGRLKDEKGIYLYLEAMHHKNVSEGFEFYVTNAGSETADGKVIEKIVHAHPWVNVIEAKKTPEEMADLFSTFDIIAMPSNNRYWNEAFGMVSVEAQHAGCQVVASNSGGLPETNCGNMILFEPGNSFDLAKSIVRAKFNRPITRPEREEAIKHFSRAQSVDLLLRAIEYVPGEHEQ